MKNLHILPTDKPSLIAKGKVDNLLAYNKFNPFNSKHWNNQNIYITSDEEIKEGDWYYLPKENKVAKCPKPLKLSNVTPEWTQKIILTTDQSLDGVQAIDDEFLEWFVKNPSCEKVETIYSLFSPMGRQVDPMNLGQNHSQCVWKYKIIIPKEELKQIKCYCGHTITCDCSPLEEPKQSIIKTEEDAKIFIEALENTPEPNEKLKKAFKNFHKQERMYSEEEVIKIVEKSRETGLTAEYLLLTEQFKKK